MTITKLEKAIYDTEGFMVSIDCENNNLKDYFLHPHNNPKAKVSEWRDRFSRRYPGASVSIQKGDGSNAHGNMLLKTLRSSYTLDSLRSQIDYLNFLVDYYKNNNNNISTETAAPDPFNILGIERTANTSEIKDAYRRKCREFHPDKLAQFQLHQDIIDFATQKMKEINSAYSEISSATPSDVL